MHAHTHHRTRTFLTLGAFATLGYVVLAFVVGMQAHSLALVSEAGHNLTDFLALALTWVGVYFETRPPTANKTFGFQRAGVLTALVNVVTLFVITVLIVVEAVARFHAPGTVATGPMLWVAVIGLVMNATIAWFLESGHHDVNLRAAFLHMVGDAAATALVIVGAIVIANTGWMVVDPILSLVIAALILASGWGIFRETLNILLEGAPRGVKSAQVQADLAAVAGVEAVHDLHIWSLGSQSHALSAHVRIADVQVSASDVIRLRLCALLDERYHIHHATLQFETDGACDGCTIREPHRSR
ncbi:MAG: cation transporter [Acidobacteria bacterium]|nr:MAG: cation transporter [Acidobacteriota bacterium]